MIDQNRDRTHLYVKKQRALTLRQRAKARVRKHVRVLEQQARELQDEISRLKGWLTQDA